MPWVRSGSFVALINLSICLNCFGWPPREETGLVILILLQSITDAIMAHQQWSVFNGGQGMEDLIYFNLYIVAWQNSNQGILLSNTQTSVSDSVPCSLYSQLHLHLCLSLNPHKTRKHECIHDILNISQHWVLFSFFNHNNLFGEVYHLQPRPFYSETQPLCLFQPIK